MSEMSEETDWSKAKRPIVFVSGCYDLLHSGHVRFFEEASRLGYLYVSLGNDKNIEMLKHHKTMFPEKEREYIVQSIRHVEWARVCEGMGDLDWENTLDRVKPDIFFVNEDGVKSSEPSLSDALCSAMSHQSAYASFRIAPAPSLAGFVASLTNWMRL